MSVKPIKIKAKSHILSLLGDELIGSDSLAIFELVKNAYDADAENVTVTFVDLNTSNQKIIIEDDGHGMTPEIIQNVWLTIGTDYKRGNNRKISKLFKRVSLGNKGVGRLAVHKLAKDITLETQVIGDLFVSKLNINWAELINSQEYIQDLTVDVESVGNSNFKKGQGTRITLSNLTTKKWTRLNLRSLARKIENIKNPFSEIPDFKININANDSHQTWLEDIKSSNDILKDSLFQFEFEINTWKKADSANVNKNDLAEFLWSYKFNPHSLMTIEGNSIPANSISKKNHFDDYKLHINNNIFDIGKTLNELDGEERNNYLLNSDLNKIGRIKGKYFVFNLSKEIVNLFFGGQKTAVENYIKDNYGIKIFRDNIRVYNYGEQSDDWLDLDLSKIKRAGDHFARKITIGAIELDLKESEEGLTEKTNREGFNENYFYSKLKAIVSNTFLFFERTAKNDKEIVEEFIEKIRPIKKVGLLETINELSKKIKDTSFEKELSPLVKRVEKDYQEMRDIMVNSGMTGLNLGIIFHEVDREMKFINADLNATTLDLANLKSRVKNLIQILEHFSPILKQNKKIKIKASELVERAKQINISRLNYHNIIFSSPLLSKENQDFEIFGAGNLLISAISNLIDNAIYWVSNKRDISDDLFKGGLYIGTDLNSFEGNAIIVADNGLGFSMEPEELIRPFVTSKPGGMGLGLYYTNLVMEMLGGKVIFPDNLDLDLPTVYNGACIALVFPKK